MYLSDKWIFNKLHVQQLFYNSNEQVSEYKMCYEIMFYVKKITN